MSSVPLPSSDVRYDGIAMTFFIVYTIIASIFLLNVVIAVLLDEFTRCKDDDSVARIQEEQVSPCPLSLKP